MKIQVLTNQCIGAGSCVAIAPNTFVLDENNQSQVTDQTGDPADAQMAAAQACPVNAIIITDDDGNQLWPPLG